MRSVFVDTSFWYALCGANEGRAAVAARCMRELGAGTLLLSTNLVFGETWTLLRSRTSHASAVQGIEQIRQTEAYMVHVGIELERSAWEWLKRRDERRYSFVDATSFVLMESMGISEAASFDRDFEAAGFTLLTSF